MNSFLKSPVFFISLTALALYLNTLKHDYVLDDFSVIKENFLVKQGIKGIPDIWETHYRYGYGYQEGKLYRPLSLSLFALEWEIAPNSPALGHAFNLILYLLLLFLIYRLLENNLPPQQKNIVFFTCLVFAAHPIHTEVVANIKSMDELLAACLGFGSYLTLYRYIKKQNINWLFGSLALMLLGLFAKESTTTLLFCIPFLLVLLMQVRINKSLKISSLYLLPLSVYLLIRYQVLGQFKGESELVMLDNVLVAAPDGLSRIATAIKILGLYLWKLIFPHPLVYDYSYKEIVINGLDDPSSWFSALIYLALIVLFFKLRKKTPILAFAIAFYLVNLALYSNIFFLIGTSFGERLLFLPSFGFALATGYLISNIPHKSTINPRQFRPRPQFILLAALLLLYGYKTINRNQAWKSNFSLYATDLENCNQSARCHYFMGLGFMKEKGLQEKNQQQKSIYFQKALNAFNRAIEIYPEYSEAWGQKGLAHYRLNQVKMAEEAYLNSVKFNPGNATSYSNLGSLYFKTQNYQAAINAFENALKQNPNHLDANANYAATLGTIGEYKAAIPYFKKAIALSPNQANYYRMLGTTYQNIGDNEKANFYLRRANQLRNSTN